MATLNIDVNGNLMTTNGPRSWSPSEFPSWVLRKVGHPILCEADWNETFPNGKWGVLIAGSGSVTRDTASLKWGGAGSCAMATAPANLSGSEIKTTIEACARPGDLLAFEAKWANAFAQGATEFQLGLESRARGATGVYQARFSWTNATGMWKYEVGPTGTYLDFNTLSATLSTSVPSCIIDNPAVNTSSGTPISWARIVIDPWAKTYHSFEAPIIDPTTSGSYAYIWDMRGINLATNGSASRALYLPFAYVIAHTNTAETGFTTDWCVSIIPSGSNPW